MPIGDDIFTQGADMDELKANITEAVLVHFAGENYHDFVVRLDKMVSQFAANWEANIDPKEKFSSLCNGLR